MQTESLGLQMPDTRNYFLNNVKYLFCAVIGVLAISVAPWSLADTGPIIGGVDHLATRDALHAENCIAPRERAAARAAVKAYRPKNPISPDLRKGSDEFTFMLYPLAGTLWEDISINYYVDMDPTANLLTWDCTVGDFTYNGHKGLDAQVGWGSAWQEMIVGVPVFAAHDGEVVATNDGEEDMQTCFPTCSPSPEANYVILDHGGGLETYYWHLKKNSVAVGVGEIVSAGQQLGLMASSGWSSGPHLHFETVLNGISIEPFAGACNPGSSKWQAQPGTIPRNNFRLHDALVGVVPYPEWPRFPDLSPPPVQPYSPLDPLGQLYFTFLFYDLPANSRYELSFVRPDGTEVASGSGQSEHPSYRFAYWSWSRSLPQTSGMTGTWHVKLRMNDILMAETPFEIISEAVTGPNRPPTRPEALTFAPAVPEEEDVLLCNVIHARDSDDPDYDLVRYLYVWSVNGVSQRTALSVAKTDALARHLYSDGDIVTCEVRPSDGSAIGQPITRSVLVGQAHSADTDRDGVLRLSELLRMVQLFNAGAYACAIDSEDGFMPDPLGDGVQSCVPHAADYGPADFTLSLSELLRQIQLFSFRGYRPCDDTGLEDGYCPR